MSGESKRRVYGTVTAPLPPSLIPAIRHPCSHVLSLGWRGQVVSAAVLPARASSQSIPLYIYLRQDFSWQWLEPPGHVVWTRSRWITRVPVPVFCCGFSVLCSGAWVRVGAAPQLWHLNSGTPSTDRWIYRWQQKQNAQDHRAATTHESPFQVVNAVSATDHRRSLARWIGLPRLQLPRLA